MKKFHVRFRHIPPELMFTSLMFIPVEGTYVESEDDNEYSLQLALAKEFKYSNYMPEHFVIEDKIEINN